MRTLFTIFLSMIPLVGAREGDNIDALRPLPTTLEETAKAHPGKDVLVLFSADWDPSGQILRKFLTKKPILEILSHREMEVYFADCTEAEGIGSIEMRRHGINATPMSAALQHRDGRITYARLKLTSIESLAHDLSVLIRKAQQAGAQNP